MNKRHKRFTVIVTGTLRFSTSSPTEALKKGERLSKPGNSVEVFDTKGGLVLLALHSDGRPVPR